MWKVVHIGMKKRKKSRIFIIIAAVLLAAAAAVIVFLSGMAGKARLHLRINGTEICRL